MNGFSALFLFLFIVLVMIGVIFFLKRKNKSDQQSSRKINSMKSIGLVDIKIDRKKYPYVKGIKNLEPNSPVYLHFDDYTIFFKTNENGELYFSPVNQTLPLACIFLIDFYITITEKSVQTYEFILADKKYDCRPIIDIQVLTGDGAMRTMRIATDENEPKESTVWLL